MPGDDLAGELDAFLAEHSSELIEFRRDLHAHPEIGYHEHRTTRRVARRLAAGGLRPMLLPKGTGLIVDDRLRRAGSGADRWRAARRPGRAAHPGREGRALPVHGAERVPRLRSRRAHHHPARYRAVPGEAGARRERCPAGIRLIFQPAEEVPGGALDVLAAGGIAGVDRIFALHCDPRLDVGKVGIRTGPITAACDKITRPGHRARRPHRPAAPDRRPGLRARQDRDRAARRADPPGGPAIQPQPGVGPGERGHRGQRDTRRRGGRGHRALPRRRGLAGRARHAQGADRLGGECLRGARRAQLPAQRAADRQRGGQRRPCSPPPRSGRWARSRSPARRRASAARTSPGTWSRSRAPWPGSAPGPRAQPSSTSTRPRSTWTSGAIGIGVRLLVQTALAALRRGRRHAAVADACPAWRTPDRVRAAVDSPVLAAYRCQTGACTVHPPASCRERPSQCGLAARPVPAGRVSTVSAAQQQPAGPDRLGMPDARSPPGRPRLRACRGSRICTGRRLRRSSGGCGSPSRWPTWSISRCRAATTSPPRSRRSWSWSPAWPTWRHSVPGWSPTTPAS